MVGRAPLVLDYEINDNAVYSDGKPITCDDMVLAWAAQSGRFPGFDAASRAGYSDIAAVDCAPGQKKARVSFAQDRAFVDYGQLFAATSMMPSHVIADELGIDVTTALQSNDGPTIDRIAQVWNTTWNLTPGPRPRSASRRRGRTRSTRSATTARWCSSPTTSGGAPSRSPQDHRVAARRRRPGPGQRRHRTTSSTSRRDRRAR